MYLRTFQCCRIVLVLGCALLYAACASRQPTVPKAEDTQVFPEVRQITFKGNTHFSSGTLRKLMATKQRPLLPPWGRGEPYNPPTLDADLLRLKKYYFDNGFLETSVRTDELQAAARVLGVSEVLIFNHPDGSLRWADVPELHAEIVATIVRCKPDGCRHAQVLWQSLTDVGIPILSPR